MAKKGQNFQQYSLELTNVVLFFELYHISQWDSSGQRYIGYETGHVA